MAVGRPTLRSVDSECESQAMEPRNWRDRRSPCRPNSWGRVESSATARGIRSCRGQRTGQTHTRVPQEPGRPALSFRKVGLGVPNPKLPGPRPCIQGRGERTAGGNERYRRGEDNEPGGTEGQESERLGSTAEAGEPISTGPGGGKRGVESSNRWRETWRRHRTPELCPRNDSG